MSFRHNRLGKSTLTLLGGLRYCQLNKDSIGLYKHKEETNKEDIYVCECNSCGAGYIGELSRYVPCVDCGSERVSKQLYKTYKKEPTNEML